MSRNTNLLDRINIPAPCSADWDSMKGNDQVRFCSQCNLNVNNLSAMTRKEARKLVTASGGKLCVRYYKKPNGRIQTAASQQLHHIKRRVSKIAAGAFTAALSLSASVAAAQTPSPDDSSASNRAEAALLIRDLSSHNPGSTASSSITGIIVDPQGAVIPGASVTLTKAQGEVEQKTATDADGKFQFQFLETGAYNIKVEAIGFASQEVMNVLIQSGEQGPSANVEVQMSIGVETGTVGGAMIMTPENPLVKAAFENNLGAVQELLNAGVEVNVIDKDVETTALAEAVSQGNLEMVKALIAAGADVNRKNSYGMTPLMSLDDDSTAELVWTMVAAGAKVNHKDDAGRTALMNVAAATETPAILQALIDAGAKVDARNHEGETALMSAIENGLVNNAKVLIEAGADLNIRNKGDETALKLARDNKQTEIVKLLESYGAIE